MRSQIRHMAFLLLITGCGELAIKAPASSFDLTRAEVPITYVINLCLKSREPALIRADAAATKIRTYMSELETLAGQEKTEELRLRYDEAMSGQLYNMGDPCTSRCFRRDFLPQDRRDCHAECMKSESTQQEFERVLADAAVTRERLASLPAKKRKLQDSINTYIAIRDREKFDSKNIDCKHALDRWEVLFPDISLGVFLDALQGMKGPLVFPGIGFASGLILAEDLKTQNLLVSVQDCTRIGQLPGWLEFRPGQLGICHMVVPLERFQTNRVGVYCKSTLGSEVNSRELDIQLTGFLLNGSWVYSFNATIEGFELGPHGSHWNLGEKFLGILMSEPDMNVRKIVWEQARSTAHRIWDIALPTRGGMVNWNQCLPWRY